MLICLSTAAYPTSASAAEGLPVIKVCKDKSHCVHAGLAISPVTRERGLMSRDKLPEESALLFVFPSEESWAFWMKDTRISLDIIWMNKDKTVVAIVNQAKPCPNEPCYAYKPREKTIYTLEVAAGLAKKWGIKTGDRLIFKVPKEILKKVR